MQAGYNSYLCTCFSLFAGCAPLMTLQRQAIQALCHSRQVHACLESTMHHHVDCLHQAMHPMWYWEQPLGQRQRHMLYAKGPLGRSASSSDIHTCDCTTEICCQGVTCSGLEVMLDLNFGSDKSQQMFLDTKPPISFAQGHQYNLNSDCLTYHFATDPNHVQGMSHHDCLIA